MYKMTVLVKELHSFLEARQISKFLLTGSPFVPINKNLLIKLGHSLRKSRTRFKTNYKWALTDCRHLHLPSKLGQ